jgi:hypothetical protein
VRPTLDQHTVTRCLGNTGQDRGRCTDRQSAR